MIYSVIQAQRTFTAKYKSNLNFHQPITSSSPSRKLLNIIIQAQKFFIFLVDKKFYSR